MGRALFYHFPEYYSLFSRQSVEIGGKTVYNTNRKLLDSYEGADGIKTGYTVAAGFNLTASAERGRERIIATVFGGTSSSSRNARVAELLDLGFKKAPRRVAVKAPARPNLTAIASAYTIHGNQSVAVASAAPAPAKVAAASTAAIANADRPPSRPAALGCGHGSARRRVALLDRRPAGALRVRAGLRHHLPVRAQGRDAPLPAGVIR